MMGLGAGATAGLHKPQQEGGRAVSRLDGYCSGPCEKGRERGRRKDAARLGFEEWKGVSFRNDWNLLPGCQRASETWMGTGERSLKDAQGRQDFQLRQVSRELRVPRVLNLFPGDAQFG